MIRKEAWVSQARFAPFLDESDGNLDVAWSLYEWNARVASALLECMHHAEVLLRNAIMDQLKLVHPLAYPWHTDMPAIVESSKKRSSKDYTAAPDDIVSQVTLGFWSQLFNQSPANDELWRQHLRHAFPDSPGTRQSVARAVTGMKELRNRCAHQDSLLEVDPAIEMLKILSLVEWIDPDARRWLDTIESVTNVAQTRPVKPARDVLVLPVTSNEGLAMYDRVSAYVCPQNRSFAAVDYIGFYVEQSIHPFFPRITHKIVPAHWGREEQAKLASSSSKIDQQLARVMGYGLSNGWTAGEQFQVFLLSESNAPETLKRSGGTPIDHSRRGRGSAFVHRHRYFTRSSLMAATNTDQLE